MSEESAYRFIEIVAGLSSTALLALVVIVMLRFFKKPKTNGCNGGCPVTVAEGDSLVTDRLCESRVKGVMGRIDGLKTWMVGLNGSVIKHGEKLSAINSTQENILTELKKINGHK